MASITVEGPRSTQVWSIPGRVSAVRFIGIATALSVGALHSWSTRYVMNPDGMSYIDVARAYARGDWMTAQNSVWSPLYSCLLAPLIRYLPSRPASEVVAAHFLNFLLYVLVLFSFDRLWKILGEAQNANIGERLGTVSPCLWTAVGYVLFISSFAPQLYLVTPDLLVAAVVFVAAWLQVKIISDGPSRRRSLLFGVLLGIGYLAKVVLFPIGIFMLLLTGGALLLTKQKAREFAFSFLGFALICAPLVISISRAQRHLSIGETGTLVYATSVTGARAGQNSVFAVGTRLLDSPETFSVPVRSGVTFAPWYDYSVLNAGLRPQFVLTNQLVTFYRNYKMIRDLLLYEHGVLAALALFLIATAEDWKRRFTRWYLALVGIAGLGLYAVVHVEGRYLPAFECILWGALLSGVVLRDSAEYRRAIRAALASCFAVLAFLALPTIVALFDFRTVPQEQLAPAMALRSTAPPGTWVGVIGDGQRQYWAQMLHVSISGVVPEHADADFWSVAPERRAGAVDALKSTGAVLVVAKNVPDAVQNEGWQPVGNNYFVLFLRK